MTRRSVRYLSLFSDYAHLSPKQVSPDRKLALKTTVGRQLVYISFSEFVMLLTFPHPQAHITIPHTNGYPICGIDHCIVQPDEGNGKDLAVTSPETVVKFSWVSKASRSIEPDLLQDCSGLFGTLRHYYSFLVCHGKDSLATNHLFLPGDGDRESCHWPVLGIKPIYLSPPTPDYRALWAYVSAYGGHSLVTASDPRSLILAVLHACLGT